MPIKYKEIARRIQLEGLDSTVKHFGRAIRKGHLKADDFSLKALAEATVFTKDGHPCGREWVATMNPARGEATLMESASAVDSTAFANLTSQLVFSATMQAATAAEFAHPRNAATRNTNFKSELIPGVTGITEDMEDDVNELMPYPQVGFGETFRETPKTTKKGRILSITKEALFFDHTGLILEAARKIGQLLGIRKEKMWARVVAGIVNNYKWKGTTYNTYQTSAPWINVKASNGIALANGWEQIDASEQLYANLTDPETGDPVVYSPNTILHMPGRKHQFRFVTAGEKLTAGTATTSAWSSTEGRNVVDSYRLDSSRWLYNEIVASGVAAADAVDWWFHLDPQEAIEEIVNWPITTVQAPANSEAEFLQDIVLRYKTSMRLVYAVKEPRAMVKNYKA